jgi:hypothetical protein
MLFNDLHAYLKARVSYAPGPIELTELGQRVSNHNFSSEARDILAYVGSSPLPPPTGTGAPDGGGPWAEGFAKSVTMIPDDEISENLDFAYHVIHPENAKVGRAIVVLHGFNERHWAKYLPWCSLLAESARVPVVLFPIAFHMNRSPASWNDAHHMRDISRLRKEAFPDIIHSTLSNAAISVRLSANPARFFWSGLQSFRDISALAKALGDGGVEGIGGGTKVDFFTYSIGTLLGEIVMMTNQDGLFSDSRMVTFCGGPVFNRLSPVSKFILDSEANVRLYSFLVEHLESHLRNDQALASFLANDQVPVGINFRSLLNYRLERPYREGKLRELSDRIYAVALAQDEVVPPYEVVNTLQGSRRDIPIRVDVVDPPYPHRHEDPFPVGQKHAVTVDKTFREVFKPICDFLS